VSDDFMKRAEAVKDLAEREMNIWKRKLDNTPRSRFCPVWREADQEYTAARKRWEEAYWHAYDSNHGLEKWNREQRHKQHLESQRKAAELDAERFRLIQERTGG